MAQVHACTLIRARGTPTLCGLFLDPVSACSDQETDEYPLRGLSNIRKLTYSIDPSVPWSEPLWQAFRS